MQTQPRIITLRVTFANCPSISSGEEGNAKWAEMALASCPTTILVAVVMVPFLIVLK